MSTFRPAVIVWQVAMQPGVLMQVQLNDRAHAPAGGDHA